MDHIEKYKRGEISFTAFAAASAPRWRAIAKYIERHWSLPAWYGREDVEQELLLAAWQFAQSFDETRGRTLGDYVRWNATDKAKKAVHKARGANLHGNADASPSRIEAPITDLLLDGDNLTPGREHARRRLMITMSIGPMQHDIVERADVLSRCIADSCETVGERLVIEAVRGADGDVSGAALMMYERPDIRRAFRFDNIDAAERVVARTARDVLSRVSL